MPPPPVPPAQAPAGVLHVGGRFTGGHGEPPTAPIPVQRWEPHGVPTAGVAAPPPRADAEWADELGAAAGTAVAPSGFGGSVVGGTDDIGDRAPRLWPHQPAAPVAPVPSPVLASPTLYAGGAVPAPTIDHPVAEPAAGFDPRLVPGFEPAPQPSAPPIEPPAEPLTAAPAVDVAAGSPADHGQGDRDDSLRAFRSLFAAAGARMREPEPEPAQVIHRPTLSQSRRLGITTPPRDRRGAEEPAQPATPAAAATTPPAASAGGSDVTDATATAGGAPAPVDTAPAATAVPAAPQVSTAPAVDGHVSPAPPGETHDGDGLDGDPAAGDGPSPMTSAVPEVTLLQPEPAPAGDGTARDRAADEGGGGPGADGDVRGDSGGDLVGDAPAEPGDAPAGPGRGAAPAGPWPGSTPVAPPVTPAPAVPAATVSTVPTDLVAGFERVTGVDLGEVPVVRGPAVDEAARATGARAFTSGGVVHLPSDAGETDGLAARALLGHELAHVAQQRVLGTDAAEDAPLGPAMEAAAVATEKALRGEPLPTRDRSAADPVVRPAVATPEPPPATTPRGGPAASRPGTPHPTAPSAPAPSTGGGARPGVTIAAPLFTPTGAIARPPAPASTTSGAPGRPPISPATTAAAGPTALSSPTAHPAHPSAPLPPAARAGAATPAVPSAPSAAVPSVPAAAFTASRLLDAAPAATSAAPPPAIPSAPPATTGPAASGPRTLAAAAPAVPVTRPTVSPAPPPAATNDGTAGATTANGPRPAGGPSAPAGVPTSGLSWTPDGGFVSAHDAVAALTAAAAAANAEHLAASQHLGAPAQRATIAPVVDVVPRAAGDPADVATADEPARPANDPADPGDPLDGLLEPDQLVGPEQLAALLAAVEAGHEHRVDGERAARGDEPDEATVAAVMGRVARTFGHRFVALDDVDALDRLAGRLYDRIRDRLRGELLVDRERGGAPARRR